MAAKPKSIAQPPFRYVGDYLDKTAADALYACLQREIIWQEETLHMFGKAVQVPRRVAWFGEPGVVYRYSGQDHQAVGWPGFLTSLRRRLGEQLQEQPDFVLLNRYDDGTQYMGWHTDNEPARGNTIASISLGARRRFLLQDEDGRSVPLDLEHGSLLLLHSQLRHCLPRSRRVRDTRINLTFRALN